MSPRRRIVFMLAVTLLMLAGAVATWGVRSGQLTIFGDDAGLVNADLTVGSPIDLEKGVAAGDQQLTVTNGSIELAPSARSGSALFVVGQREIVGLHRIVPAASDEGVSIAVAGSLDGISFTDFSPLQRVAFDTVNGQRRPRPIELGFLIPEGSRFLRVRVVLEQTTDSVPRFSGFTVNYSQRDTLASDTTLLVNGSPVEGDPATPAPNPGRPETLVVTGPRGVRWVVLASGLGGMLLLAVSWFSRKEGHGGRAPAE